VRRIHVCILITLFFKTVLLFQNILYKVAKKPLVPNLRDILPNNMKYIPYEIGYLLWNYLQRSLGEENFLKFIRHCIHNQTNSIITTEIFKNNLVDFFWTESEVTYIFLTISQNSNNFNLLSDK